MKEEWQSDNENNGEKKIESKVNMFYDIFTIWQSWFFCTFVFSKILLIKNSAQFEVAHSLTKYHLLCFRTCTVGEI